ncbi:MAG TPA: hypothetical protein H9814_11220 [Candidatus Bacteroides merdigallinarum]|uniref:Glycosyltransferase n=1 Tax=Candidatus Bacteroides merdigallinarum TaxID=2838473 RepID=A0A9D2EA77_9BACE|nr:hypothetical protein [Candidatus Bacteroides merdigallinarum]
MEKVKIVDYYAVGTFHEVINYSFVKMCASIFKEVQYFSGKTATLNQQQVFIRTDGKSSTNVHYNVMVNFEQETPIGARLRDLWGFFLTLYQYLITPYNTFLFYNYTNKLSLPFILLLNILLRKKVVFLFHGELEFLEGKVSYLKTSGWYRQSMRFSFHYLFMKSPAYVMVLGDSIRKNLSNIYPNLFSHIISICHPYILNEFDDYKAQKCEGSPMRIGTVGTMKASKGLKELLRLSDLLKDLLEDGKLELYSVGRVYADGIQLGDNITWIGHKNGLLRDEFEKEVQRLDYLLYLYPIGSYRFTASGAILDAVKMNKPIIALHNDYFDYLLDGCPIGYVGNTVEELAQVIRDIVKGNLCDNFSAGLKGLSDKISLERNTHIFENELRRVDCV